MIINNIIKWDGEHIGEGIMDKKWKVGTTDYGEIITEEGTIYCIYRKTKNLFPCIVEEIKEIFGLPKRGLHRITINKKEHIIYYVPITENEELVWETPLNYIDGKNEIRKNGKFIEDIRKIIIFSDILALENTSETMIKIRLVDGNYIPINCNDKGTYIIRQLENYDFSIISKTLFTKWLGEKVNMRNIVREMLKLKTKDIGVISMKIREKINEIIKKYDNNYIWYSNFVVDRMSRHIL